MNVNDVIKEINKDKINLIFYLAIERNDIIECVLFTEYMCHLSEAENAITAKLGILRKLIKLDQNSGGYNGGYLEHRFNYFIQCDSASYKIFNSRKELNDNILNNNDGYKICFIYSEADNEITTLSNNNAMKILDS